VASHWQQQFCPPSTLISTCIIQISTSHFLELGTQDRDAVNNGRSNDDAVNNGRSNDDRTKQIPVIKVVTMTVEYHCVIIVNGKRRSKQVVSGPRSTGIPAMSHIFLSLYQWRQTSAVSSRRSHIWTRQLAPFSNSTVLE
jgi:hypothetical protein